MNKRDKHLQKLKRRFDENSRLIAKQKKQKGIMIGDKREWSCYDPQTGMLTTSQN